MAYKNFQLSAAALGANQYSQLGLTLSMDIAEVCHPKTIMRSRRPPTKYERRLSRLVQSDHTVRATMGRAFSLANLPDFESKEVETKSKARTTEAITDLMQSLLWAKSSATTRRHDKIATETSIIEKS